ncbi:hypothetical protein L9F63_003229 [Diploptera punctata]|uniref:Nuclear export mediator factor NEMF homolog n=1 Tax=Diploptera punctata TaxID=6984 RepID=A0AAD8EA21_DIPPU|nr:hypothetical protein L9F63_003229 [Diploptera punctata]
MKTRFSTLDLVCSITELQKLIGMRVAQVYDADHKTYLIKLQRTEEKCVLLIESGIRLHTTSFEWPKNIAPSGFSMKMRKHLRNKRLESLKQLGMDRIVDLQFGTGEAAYHVILELYDRGNIVLTDCNMIILNILRPHSEGEERRFAVREKYPLETAREREGLPSVDKLRDILLAAKDGESLKKVLIPHLEYGPALIDHALLKAGYKPNCKIGKDFNINEDLLKLIDAFHEAEHIMDQSLKQPSKGYIMQKKQKRPLQDGGEEDFYSSEEFHPMIFLQHNDVPVKEFSSFDTAVDEFFSTLESQKIDMKALHQEKEAVKKLANVRKDHEHRLENLARTQEEDKKKAELISRNQQLVENAILATRSALANQLPWPDIHNLIKEAQAKGDPVASSIKGLKLEINHITMLLADPYARDTDSSEDSEVMELKPTLIDIDLDCTAFANARKYYDKKKNAAKKEIKTIESQGKALKSAERKTKQTLKEVKAITSINKARKFYWFEKFFWFVSSENYLVIGGRDQQQNELIVKRYMKPGDIYVHADIQGASSIVIKNPSGQPVPPKTLNEAGSMAVSYSVAWDAKVVTSAWWVQSDQVSKTAPTGEYLTTGSFMVRGKKNYLPPCHLIMGFSFLFKLDESSMFRHKDERKVREIEDDEMSVVSATNVSEQEEQEIDLNDNETENDKKSSDEEEQDKYDDERDSEESDNIEQNDINEEFISNEASKDSRDLNAVSSQSYINGQHKSSEEKQRSDEGNVEFPDTEIKIKHVTGNQIALQATSTSILQTPSQSEEQVIFLGDDKPVTLKQRQPKQSAVPRVHKKSLCEDNEKNTEKEQPKQQQQLKRGQKGKLKKIKDKYKYQDEEERKLRMEILQSAGTGKENKKGKKGSENDKNQSKTGKKLNLQKVPKPAPKPRNRAEGDDAEAGEAAEEIVVAAEVDMLDSLTGLPVSEDELLFAIPVVAPYSTLHNYKFKVKLTPGTGKRGKAAKTAIDIFLKDRATTPREKDLIKSVKDENLARNLPGKVKLSAPQLQKHKR